MLEASGCQPAPSLASSGGQARGHDTKEARNEGSHDHYHKASTIVSGGILALSLAVVLLAATASTASAGARHGVPMPVVLPAASDAVDHSRAGPGVR